MNGDTEAVVGIESISITEETRERLRAETPIPTILTPEPEFRGSHYVPILRSSLCCFGLSALTVRNVTGIVVMAKDYEGVRYVCLFYKGSRRDKRNRELNFYHSVAYGTL